MIDTFQIRSTIVDLGSVVPSCLMILLCVAALGARHAWRRAALFGVVLLLALGIGIATKVAYYGWNVSFGLAGFRGASGNAARAAALYPTLAWIVFAGSSRIRCWLAVSVGALVALAVTIATIDKSMHTLPEAITGALIGASVPFAVARAGQLRPLSGLVQTALVVCAFAIMATVPSKHYYDFEQVIVDFSRRLR